MKNWLFSKQQQRRRTPPQTIDVIALELVVTDLRAAASSTPCESPRRHRPFYQITNTVGTVIGRSSVLLDDDDDVISDAPFPVVTMRWKDVVGPHPSDDDDDHQDAAAVMHEPLLITLYDWCPRGQHEILGQVSTDLWEMVEKSLNHHDNLHHHQTGEGEERFFPPELRMALIWDEVAVVGDLYVTRIQFYQQSNRQRRRRRQQQQQHHHCASSRFAPQPGFPNIPNVPTPPGIPAGVVNRFSDTDDRHEKRSVSWDPDATLSTVSGSLTDRSPSPSPRADGRGRRPAATVSASDGYRHGRSRALLEATRERVHRVQRKRDDMRNDDGDLSSPQEQSPPPPPEEEEGVTRERVQKVHKNLSQEQTPPRKEETYTVGRTRSLIALAQRLAAERRERQQCPWPCGNVVDVLSCGTEDAREDVVPDHVVLSATRFAASHCGG